MGRSNRDCVRGGLSALALAAGLSVLHAAPAGAQTSQAPLPVYPNNHSYKNSLAYLNNDSDENYVSDESIWRRDELLGDVDGLRDLGHANGVSLDITDSENLLGNLLGGVKQGGTMQGLTTATLEVDTGAAFNLPGGTLHVSALQIHGQPLTGPYLDDLQAANGNEGENTTRLWELWYDQAFDHGLIDVQIGQQSIDNEFIVSQYSGLFVNTMAGWPAVPSYDLYGGGPAYPLSSLGVRLQFKPAVNQNVLMGVFDDNPGGGAFSDDAQALEKDGAKFNLNTGALYIAEYQYSIGQPQVGQMVTSDNPAADLPGTYKIGFWYDSGSFPDQRYGTDGLSLADGNGDPIMHHGNYGLYAVADQTVWESSVADQAAPAWEASTPTYRTVNLFARVMGAPDRQNLIDFFVNGGITVTDPLPGRINDQAGIDFGLVKVSSRAAGLDRDSGVTAQTTEELFEATYQAQIVPWLVVQPDFQYIVHPGAGVADPNDPTRDLRNEFVAGLRVITTF